MSTRTFNLAGLRVGRERSVQFPTHAYKLPGAIAAAR